jgi:hypothetical protein
MKKKAPIARSASTPSATPTPTPILAPEDRPDDVAGRVFPELEDSELELEFPSEFDAPPEGVGSDDGFGNGMLSEDAVGVAEGSSVPIRRSSEAVANTIGSSALNMRSSMVQQVVLVSDLDLKSLILPPT